MIVDIFGYNAGFLSLSAVAVIALIVFLGKVSETGASRSAPVSDGG